MEDFENQLALIGGNNWPSNSNLSHLSTTINLALQSALLYIDLPSNNYEPVQKVGRTAGNLKNLGSYRSTNSRDMETWYSYYSSI